MIHAVIARDNVSLLPELLLLAAAYAGDTTYMERMFRPGMLS
jgi:hypothetical protein